MTAPSSGPRTFLRILLVANEAHRTGAPLVAIETARAAAATSDVVSVVKRGSALVPEFRKVSSNIVLHPAGALEAWIPRARTRGLPTCTRWWERRVAERVIAQTRPDVVYGHTIESAEYVAVGHALGIPTVLHLHEPYEKLIEYVAPFGLGPGAVPTKVIGCAVSIAADAERFFGLAAGEADVVVEPVDVADVQRRAAVPPPPDLAGGPVVLTVGSMTRVKGVDLWIDVVAQVDPAIRFAWIGTGPKRRWVERQLRRRGLSDRVTILGPRDDPMPYMAAADLVLLPSRYEGLPLVLLEALSVGTPCVAFAVNGVPDAVGPDGRVVTPSETAEMAAAVTSVLDDGPLAERVAQSGPERMRREFDVSQFHRRTRKVLSDLGAGS